MFDGRARVKRQIRKKREKEIMKTTTRNPKPNSPLQPRTAPRREHSKSFSVAVLFVVFVFMLFGTSQTRAQGIPPGCLGSAIGISLFTSAPGGRVVFQVAP